MTSTTIEKDSLAVSVPVGLFSNGTLNTRLGLLMFLLTFVLKMQQI